MNTSYFGIVESPVGPLTVRWTDDALTGLWFDRSATAPTGADLASLTRDDARLRLVRDQLDEYFGGARSTFDLPLRFVNGTPFQQRVWAALREIPFGETRSYGELAKQVGEAAWPGARAVGAANGQNPIAIVVPCHRVIGANGALTGFGGGLPRKRWLLTHEGHAETARPKPRRAALAERSLSLF